MSIDLDRINGVAKQATSTVGARGYDRPSRRVYDRVGDGSVRSYEESLGELSMQLAARFARDPVSIGKASSALHEPPAHGRAGALIFAFCLGVTITIAFCGVAFFHQDVFRRYLFDQANEPALSHSARLDTLLPSGPVAHQDRSAYVAAITEPVAVVPAEPASIAIAQDDISSDKNRALDAEEIREVQIMLQSIGLNPGPADGISGPLTAAAVKRYQESKGQAVLGGITRELLGHLRQAMASPVSATGVVPRRPSVAAVE